MNYSDLYYIQQQKEEEDSYTPPSSEGLVQDGIMFQVLEERGEINEVVLNAYLEENRTVLENNNDILINFYNQLNEIPVLKANQDLTIKNIDLHRFIFDDNSIQAVFSNKNVPSMWYISKQWKEGNDEKYFSGEKNIVYVSESENTTAGSNIITDVSYYRYKSKNPFFSADDSYNTDTYENASGRMETYMARFEFYRFTGKGGGVAALDNMLVAVDTYTGLVFSFGVPTEFISILGNDNPTRWDAVETVLATDGKKHFFYEYDPAGYIADDGNFMMYEWYTNNLSEANASNKNNFIPQYTGISPYALDLKVKKPIITTSANELPENNYYTELEISFVNSPTEVEEYHVYRMDDSESEKKLITTIKANGVETEYLAKVQDKEAVIIKSLPKYIVEAKDKDGNTIGESSDATEGYRNLNQEEIIIVVMEAIRNALVDQNLHAMLFSSKTIFSENGGSIKHERKGDIFSSFAHTYIVSNYKTDLVTLTSGSFAYESDDINNASIDTVTGSIENNKAFNGDIFFELDSKVGSLSGKLSYKDIHIANNDKNNPLWQEGNLSLIVESQTSVFENTGKIPFGFYMETDFFTDTVKKP